MTHSEATHKMLVLGVIASVSFTIYVSGLLFGEVSAINQNVDKLIADVGYIKGLLDGTPPIP